ncbi:MAG: oligosaccharide flippase family protein [Patescibacteria group bacterium]|nr:oligosaccharide flippase family protein [Patescibacteria group bacterium]
MNLQDLKEVKKFTVSLVKNYSKDTFILGFPQVVVISITLVTLPIILANLSIEDYGRLQFVFAIQLWLTALTAGHMTTGAQRGVARGLEGTFLFAFFSRLKLILPIGFFVLLSTPFVYYAGFPVFAYLLVVMGIYLLIGYLAGVSYTSVFIAKKQFKEIAIWRIVATVVTLFSTVVAAVLTHNIIIYAIVYFGVTSLTSLAGFLYVVKKNHLFWAWRKGDIDKKPFTYGISMIPADIILQTSQKITDFIIGSFFGFGNLAIFSVARNLERQARTPAKLLHNLLYSDFSRNELSGIIQKVHLKLRVLFLLSTLFTLGIALVGSLYISFFLPPFYKQAVLYFLILSLSLPAVLLQTILHTILATNLRHKELSALIITSNVFQILFIGIGGLFFGIIGVTIGLVLGAWLNFVLYYFMTIRQIKRV